jgi:peptide/nickel transport system ATP-binding protein
VLAVDGLSVQVDSESGIADAVRMLSLAIYRGQTFALVGESGCGKSMTALALLRLLPDAGRIAGGQIRLGEVELNGLSEQGMRAVRGGQIGIIFQEPATSLNPVKPCGHIPTTGGKRWRSGRRGGWGASAFPMRNSAWMIIPSSFREGRSSAS